MDRAVHGRMKAGDVVMSNGMKFNVNDYLAARKK